MLPFLVPLLQSSLFIHWSQKHLPLFILLNLYNSRVGVIIRPLDCQHLILVKCLIRHGFFSKLSHASMNKLNKSITFMRQNIYILYLTPHRKMPQKNLIHLNNSLLSVRQAILTNIKSFCLFSKWTNTFHILSKISKTRSSKNIFCLINTLAIFNTRNFVIISTVNSIRTASSREEKAIICCSFLVKKISSSITNIKFRIASCQSCFLVFLVFGADILAIPEVILLISFFICIIISKRCLNLLPGSSFLRISES